MHIIIIIIYCVAIASTSFTVKHMDHKKNIIIEGKITHEDDFLSDLHLIFINRIDLLFGMC